MISEIASAFIEGSRTRVEHARGKMDHCLAQLADEDIWWTPQEGSNSIGVIIQHLMGNLRQWVISGVGGAPDVRDRSREFRVGREVPKAEMQGAFSALLDEVVAVYSGVGPDELLEPRRIQGSETTVLSAIFETTCHLQLHVGQVLFLTRLRLGEAYEESWRPETKEQGA